MGAASSGLLDHDCHGYQRSQGKVTAAINLSGPDAVMGPEGTTEKFVALQRECSGKISAELEYVKD